MFTKAIDLAQNVSHALQISPPDYVRSVLGNPDSWSTDTCPPTELQLAEVREKVTKKYKLKLASGFRCDFHDPFGNRIQVVDLQETLYELGFRVSRAAIESALTVHKKLYRIKRIERAKFVALRE
jgi:hypothetical protein